jgi:pyruvate/2-oxoacid:ferredoxin oxidoreductase alpha subunit
MRPTAITKHVLLFPEDPKECFDFGALAFDLADRLQTPIFVLLDLDIGMNERLCEAVTLGRFAPLRSRQSHELSGSGSRQGVRPLSRRG